MKLVNWLVSWLVGSFIHSSSDYLPRNEARVRNSNSNSSSSNHSFFPSIHHFLCAKNTFALHPKAQSAPDFVLAMV